ncbi:MAG: DUF6807 domain-containing protein [Planctomycetota bacterium]
MQTVQALLPAFGRPIRSLSLTFLLLFLVCLPAKRALSKIVAKIQVQAGKHTRIDTPVSVRLAQDPDPGGSRLWLEEITGSARKPIAFQLEQGEPRRLWWILSGATPAGHVQTYELVSQDPAKDPAFDKAMANGRQANEGFERCRRFVEGWLKYADPRSGLIPRGLRGERTDIWNAQDAGADNYPFMVLTAAVTDRALFEGRMLDMLHSETRLTSRLGAMPDTYCFSKRDFVTAAPDVDAIMFGSSEYIKDGLLPLTEWLGQSPWSERMLAILDDMWKRAPIETKFGRIVSDGHEVNGEMLQVLSRMYWMTGDQKYLDWAVRIGDYYLLGDHHPTRDASRLRLRDHGCEIVGGLCELYATVNFAMPQKKQLYQLPIHEMLDRILEVGRNKYGLLYDWIDPNTGQHSDGIADTWGYNLNGFYTVYLIDGTEPYRRAVLDVLGALYPNYVYFRWEGNYSADGAADSIESAINLYNREPVAAAARWIDAETKVMWRRQKPDGIIHGSHGDGNFARTTIMYCLWKTKGLTIEPWRRDVVFGAVQSGNGLKIAIVADKAWKGRLIFDSPRHEANMKMPLDWPRINQFPEWFTIRRGKRYSVEDRTSVLKSIITGGDLQKGLDVDLQPGAQKNLLVLPESGVKIVKNESFLQIELDGAKVLRYNHAPYPPPPGVDKIYTRSGFVHPLWSPDGTVLTDIHPPDHVHHMGVWMAWPMTMYQGREIDFWNSGDAQGTVSFARFLSTVSGPVLAGFRAQHEQLELTGAKGKALVISETWDVRVYNVGRGEKKYWLWDFVSTQRCATDSPVELPEYRYGGLGLRATRQWKEDNSGYLTSEGKNRENGHRTRARWCDMFGTTEAGWAGVTVFSHPSNFRHPEPMRIWPAKFKHVFFNFAPCQLGDWVMEPGRDYVFRYRFYVHEGKTNVADTERIWNDFAEPPEVKIQWLSGSSPVVAQ